MGTCTPEFTVCDIISYHKLDQICAKGKSPNFYFPKINKDTV